MTSTEIPRKTKIRTIQMSDIRYAKIKSTDKKHFIHNKFLEWGGTKKVGDVITVDTMEELADPTHLRVLRIKGYTVHVKPVEQTIRTE